MDIQNEIDSPAIAFVIASSRHGPLILNVNDHTVSPIYGDIGVGHQIMATSSFEPEEINLALQLLQLRREYFGDGVFAIDGGANIGVHTIEWARQMHGWGEVLGFEAQEVVFYALAGNVAINNCLNARVKLSALGETCGELAIPQPNYFQPSSFGSLEIKQRENTEFIGQNISYDKKSMNKIPMISIDSLNLQRLDFFKVDVEGMEVEVLKGSTETLKRCKPIMLVEVIKSDHRAIQELLESLGYLPPSSIGGNEVFIHRADPTASHVNSE